MDYANTYIHPTGRDKPRCRECRRLSQTARRKENTERKVRESVGVDLTTAEQFVWKMVGYGLSNAEIGKAINPSVSTRAVEGYINRLYSKLWIEGEGNSKRVRLARSYLEDQGWLKKFRSAE